MTIHKIKEEFMLKASIGELMAVTDGIVCAGVTAARKGADTKTDPIASLGYGAAILSYSVRTELSFGRMDMQRVAGKITEFLKSSRDVLVGYPDAVLSLPKGNTGGTLRDVLSHIDEILVREEIGGERPAFKIVNGNLQEKFKATYAPKPQKEDPAEAAFDGDAEEAPPVKARGGRPRTKTQNYAAPANVLA